MKKIIAFSKYIFYSVGGAEKSMMEILKRKDPKQYEITLLGVDNLKSFNSSNYEISNLKDWKRIAFKLKHQVKKFAYFEYWLNKNHILNYFKTLDMESDLYTYGFFAPPAVLGFSGKSTVFLRNEADIGINANYYTGFKRLIKFIHILIEYPFYLIYLRDIKSCYQKSHLIFNSQWMASECKKRFGVTGEIEYPMVDFSALTKNYQINNIVKDKGIVFIGDSELKGISIVKKIASILNEFNFYIFTRHITEKVKINNITYLPWSLESSIPYTYAKLLIVPSKWNEAFGRVSIEAQHLGIPVLVSNRGGLPETVKFDNQFIVQDYLKPKEWVRKIRELNI